MMEMDGWQILIAIGGPLAALVSFAGMAWRTWVVPMRRAHELDVKAREEIAIWRALVDRRFEAIDARLDRHEKRDDRMFAALDRINGQLQDILERLSNIEGRLKG